MSVFLGFTQGEQDATGTVLGANFRDIDVIFGRASPTDVADVSLGRLNYWAKDPAYTTPTGEFYDVAGQTATLGAHKGDIFVMNPGAVNYNLLYFTILHETCHILGLIDVPYAIATNGFSASYANTHYTVMTYERPDGFLYQPHDLQLYDVAALQHMQGADRSDVDSTIYNKDDEFSAGSYGDRQWCV